MSDTDAVAAALVGLRLRERELELEAVAVKARVEEIRDMIERLEPRRRPRPRVASVANPYQSQGLQQSPNTAVNTAAQNIVPQRVESGMASAEVGLPSLDDVRGILKIPEDAA